MYIFSLLWANGLECANKGLLSINKKIWHTFASHTYIINTSMKTGKVPTKIKHAKVIPIYKKDKQSQ